MPWVYVVIVAEHHALAGISVYIGIFVFLFTIVWWAWFNGAIYHDTHGNNDIRTRVFTFLQMITVAAMAVFAHNATGEGSVGFALHAASLILPGCGGDRRHDPIIVPFSLIHNLSDNFKCSS
jgi:low temperature requirement protein LtrA